MRIRWLAIVVWIAAACGCNQAFGLDKTGIIPPLDATYFDAPADAPFACWQVGTPPPAFSRILHQIPQDCREYSVAGDRAIAMCEEPAPQISQGPIDGAMTPIAGLEQASLVSYTQPRLLPEGDQLLLQRHNQMMALAQFQVYQRGAADDWTFAYALNSLFESYVQIGQPTRGPLRRAMAINIPDGLLHEIEFDSTGFYTDAHTYDFAELGVDSLPAPPYLSPDGLRMIFPGGKLNVYSMYFADRSSIAAKFSIGTVLQAVPFVYDAFLTEDCARIYFSANVRSMFWIQQQ